MFVGTEQIGAVMSALERRDACLFHACQLQDLATYRSLGGIASRGSMSQASEPFTAFDTDAQDAVNGVWAKVFVNLRDFGTTFARRKRAVPNPYGPILLQLARTRSRTVVTWRSHFAQLVVATSIGTRSR